MVITAIILIAIFRKPVLGAIAMAPVILSTVWVLGTMYLFDIPLNVMTITITSLTVGLGIDYSVYITERFRDERRTHGIRRSMRRTIERTGTAVVLASLTTVLGFSLLIMAPLPILRNFGLISASAIAFGFVLGVFMLPLALVVWSFHESGILAGRIKEEVVVRGDRRVRAGRAQMRSDVGEEEEGEVDMGEVEEKEEDVEAEETGDVEQAEREGEEQDEDVYDGPIFASQGKASKEKRMRRQVEGPSRTSKGKGRGREGSGSNGS